MKNPTELNFTPIGAYGIEAAVTEENVFLKLSRSTDKATLSASGKTKMTASTGGFAAVPGTDYRVNVNGGVRV